MIGQTQRRLTGVLFGLLVVGGCASPGLAPQATSEAPGGDRHVMQADSFAFEQVLALLPAQLTEEQAAAQLVRIPEDQVARRSYGVQQLRLGRFYDDDIYPFTNSLRNNLTYYRSGNYYLPYYRSGSTYYPYNNITYRSRFSDLFGDDDDDLLSPYYFRSGDRYYPYTYTGSSTANRTVLVRHVIVNIKDFEYLPNNFRLEQNGTVAWLNMDSTVHTATADNGSPPTTTGDILPGQTSAPITFFTRGRFPYHCQYHPEMEGTFSIEAAATPAPSPSVMPTPMPTMSPAPAPSPSPTASPSVAPTASPSPY